MTVVLLCVSAVALLVAVFIVAAYRRRWEWTGFAGSAAEGRESKTLWDWLQLLVIPLALAAVAFVLNIAQSSREQQREDQRANIAQILALDQRREDALAAYLRQMSDLLLQHKLSSPSRGRVLTVARTFTLSVLPRLDGKRKGQVLQFLAESRLVDTTDPTSPVLNLDGADLRAVVLHDVFIHGVFRGADMRGADFRDASLYEADLARTKLGRAHFDGAQLRGVSLFAADLRRASFRRALIDGGDFDSACLTRVSFNDAYVSGTFFRDTGGKHIDLSHAELHSVDFSAANFSQHDVNLTGADLFDNDKPPLTPAMVGRDESRCHNRNPRSSYHGPRPQ
jgi:hypothetical protein